MGGLKVYSSQQRRQGPVGAGRIDPGILETGQDQATLSATQAMGQTLSETARVGAQLKHAEMMVDLAKRTGQREQAYRDAMRRMTEEPDIAAHDAILGEFDAQVKTLGQGLKGFAADKWQADSSQQGPRWMDGLMTASNARKKEILLADTRALFETGIREKNIETLTRAAFAAVNGGLMTQAAADNEMAKGALAIKQGYIVEHLTADLTSGKKNLQEVKDLLSHEELTLTLPDGRTDTAVLPAQTRQAMLRDLTYWHAQQKAIEAEHLETAREQDRSLLFDGLADKSIDAAGNRRLFTYEDIQNTSLEESEKAQFWTAYQKKYKTEKEAENLAFKLSDPTVELEVLRRIDLNDPQYPITTREIYALAGKGLSIEDAKSAADRLKARDAAAGKKSDIPLVGKQVLEDMDRLYHAAFFVDGDPAGQSAKDRSTDERLLNMRRFVGLRKELTQWMEKNPTASDTEILEKYNAIVGETRQEGLWSRVWDHITRHSWKGLLGIGGQIYGMHGMWQDRKERHANETAQPQYWDDLALKHDLPQQQVQAMVDATLRGAGIDPGAGPVFKSVDTEQEPASAEEFIENVAAIEDDAAAKAYYRKWAKKWQ